MAAQPKLYSLIEQYLELEQTDENKHEYFEGEIFALAGGSENHNLIAANLDRKI